MKASIYSPLPPSRPPLLGPLNESIKSWFMHRVWLHFNCRHKNRRETRRLPPLLCFLLSSAVFPLSVTTNCKKSWWMSFSGSNLMTKHVCMYACVIVMWEILCTFICRMWVWLFIQSMVWLNVFLCLITLALSNESSLLTTILSEHKKNWSRNQHASPGLRAVKWRIKSLINVLEQLVQTRTESRATSPGFDLEVLLSASQYAPSAF